MIVCVCNNVSERDIHNAVSCGITTIKGLRDELGVSACCGKCGPCAKKVLNDAKSSQESVFSSLAVMAA
jgi:bacterioferritin-associated ferredoxin